MSNPSFEEVAAELADRFDALFARWRSDLKPARAQVGSPSWTDEETNIADTTLGLENEELLVWIHRFCCTLLQLSIKDDLKALTRLYEVPDGISVNETWPSSSAFALVRSILEGSSILVWLYADGLPRHTRLLRAAGYLQSSQRWRHQAVPGLDDGMDQLLSAIENMTPDEKRAAKEPGKLDLCSAAFGQAGARAYRHWSGHAHSYPWKLAPSALVQPTESGDGIRIDRDPLLQEHIGAAVGVTTFLHEVEMISKRHWKGRESDAVSAPLESRLESWLSTPLAEIESSAPADGGAL